MSLRFVENRFGCGVGFGQTLAHADGLGSLAGKEEGDRWETHGFLGSDEVPGIKVVLEGLYLFWGVHNFDNL